tara:strand:- start:416 stop:616 length:201 start_codon:yes stop_codon:yes gene_type:complete
VEQVLQHHNVEAQEAMERIQFLEILHQQEVDLVVEVVLQLVQVDQVEEPLVMIFQAQVRDQVILLP